MKENNMLAMEKQFLEGIKINNIAVLDALLYDGFLCQKERTNNQKISVRNLPNGYV